MKKISKSVIVFLIVMILLSFTNLLNPNMKDLILRQYLKILKIILKQ